MFGHSGFHFHFRWVKVVRAGYAKKRKYVDSVLK
jgi:hypothetical protein